MFRKSLVRLRCASSRICPASSTPVGPAPTIDEGHPELLQRGIAHRLGELESAVDAAPQLHGVVDRLHAGCDQGELVVAEVRLPRARRHDEAVIGVLAVSPGSDAVCTTRRSRSNPVTLERTTVTFLCLRNLCRSTGEICAGREDAGRHLVEQRLEEVVVPLVDERDVDVGARKAGGWQAGRRSRRPRRRRGAEASGFALIERPALVRLTVAARSPPVRPR